MNCWDGIHWNINEILTYQRNFNFITSRRSNGKTYSTEMFIVNKCIELQREFIYIVRTKNEIDDNGFWDGMEKVLNKEFPQVFDCDKRRLYWLEEIGTQKNGKPIYIKHLIGHAVALSEVYKMKKKSFYNVYYMIFDEYVIEKNSKNSYIDGWNEPDRLLSLYDTVDRSEDRVKVFFLGNTISFYNPYHVHPAFQLEKVEEGEIWTNENCLYQRAKESQALTEQKESSKFGRMIMNTKYGSLAMGSEFVEDSDEFIGTIGETSQFMFSFIFENNKYGVWANLKEKYVVISDKIDKTSKLCYTLSPPDHNGNALLIKGRQNPHMKWLGKMYSNGMLYFTSQEIKVKLQDGMVMLI